MVFSNLPSGIYSENDPDPAISASLNLNLVLNLVQSWSGDSTFIMCFSPAHGDTSLEMTRL